MTEPEAHLTIMLSRSRPKTADGDDVIYFISQPIDSVAGILEQPVVRNRWPPNNFAESVLEMIGTMQGRLGGKI